MTKIVGCSALLLAACGAACAQQAPASTPALTSQLVPLPASHHGLSASTPTPLASLLSEAVSENSQIAAANDAWKAASHVARQVSTLPDPQLTVQSLSVGNPLPFAGLSNSNFAYIGIGASQQIPYPGKLRLKGEVAADDTRTAQAQRDVVRSQVTEQIKLLYLQIAYLQAMSAILERTGDVLGPLIDSALSHYKAGQGSQPEVLKAQLQRTQLLRSEVLNQQQAGEAQADLKQFLHRPQSSADIAAEPLKPTALRLDAVQLQELAAQANPSLLVDQRAVAKQDTQLEAAKRDAKPDFNLGYMVQVTGPSFPNYYMLTLNMGLPRRGRAAEEAAQATEQTHLARHTLDADRQQQLAEVQKQYVAASSTAQMLDQYTQGLIPQAQAVLRSEQADYQAGRGEFAAVLSSLLDLFTMQSGLQQTLLEHETAMVRLETLTGADLR